jgi:hypothetical protein
MSRLPSVRYDSLTCMGDTMRLSRSRPSYRRDADAGGFLDSPRDVACRGVCAPLARPTFTVRSLFLTPQQKLWMESGSGRRPRL